MAASAQGIRAGKAFVEIGAVDKTGRVLNNIARRMTGFGKSLTKIGAGMIGGAAAITGPLVAASMQFSKMGDQLNKMAARTGVSVAELSRLKFAAEQSGAELSQVENGIRRMQSSVFDLGRGLSTATDSFDVLGLSAADLEGKSPEEQFNMIGNALGKVEDKSLQAALAQKIFGRSGTALAPMFKNLQGLREESDRLNLTMTDAEANGAARFTDAMHRLTTIAKRVAFVIGGAVANSLTGFLERIAPIVSNVISFVQRNQGLIVSLLKIGAIVGVVGAGVVVLGTAIVLAGAVFSGAASIISVGAGAISGALGIATTAASIFWAALTSPAVLAIAAIAGVIGLVIHASGALAGLGESFGALGGTFKEVWGAIVNALKAGDLEGAGKIALSGLKLVWFEALADLQQRWADFKFFIVSIFTEAMAEVKRAVVDMQGAVSNALIDIAATDTVAGSAARALLGVDDTFDADDAAGARGIINQQNAGRTSEIDRQQSKFLESLKEVLEQDVAKAREDVEAARNDFKRAADAIEASPVVAPIPGGAGGPASDPGGIAKAITTTMPAALERGTVGAASKAFENKQKQLASEHLNETKTTNEKLDDLPTKLGDEIAKHFGAV